MKVSSAESREIYINLLDPRGFGNGSEHKGRSIRNALRGRGRMTRDPMLKVDHEEDRNFTKKARKEEGEDVDDLISDDHLIKK